MESPLVAALRNAAACPGTGPGSPQWYTDPIELSNACREFYQCRLESARAFKERWGLTSSPPCRQAGETTPEADRGNTCQQRKKSSIDVAMETLRQEMTSLMEQDLTLMKQLLTLNEEIEELKWRRRYGWPRAASSLMTSSGDVDRGSLASFTSSDASLSWWRGDSGGDLHAKYPGMSSLSLYSDGHTRLPVCDEEDTLSTISWRSARSGHRKMSATGGGSQLHLHLYKQQQQQQQQQQHKQPQ